MLTAKMPTLKDKIARQEIEKVLEKVEIKEEEVIIKKEKKIKK